MSDFKFARTKGTRGKTPLFLFCDHATNVIPEPYGQLGLTHAQLEDHIAYDPGAARLTEVLAEEFDCRALFCGFSRLLIDPNRGLDRDDLILPVSDTIHVPGNQNLTHEDRRHRIDAYFTPYHDVLRRELDAIKAEYEDAFVVSLHSFCRALRSEGTERPWQAGLLWRDDVESAETVMAHLRDEGISVGDNKPYSAKIYNYSVNRHVAPRGLRHVTLEIRQDLLTSEKSIFRWKDLLFPPLRALING